MPHLRYILFLILTLPSLAAPSLHVDISESTFYVGAEFRYEILITGAEKVSADVIEGDDTLAIQFVGQTAVERGGDRRAVGRRHAAAARLDGDFDPSDSE